MSGSGIKNSDGKNRIAIVFIILALAMAFASVPLGVTARNASIFSAYQIILVFLPGIAVEDLLFDRIELKPLEFMFIGFAIGYAINILEYFIVAIIGLTSKKAVVVAVLVPVLSCLGVKHSKKSATVSAFSRDDIPFAVLFLMLLIVVYFAYCANFVLPTEERSSVRYHRDALYWIENAISLKISFPPQELRYSGVQLFYHYFASVYIAIAGLVTGIDSFSLGYALYPLTRCMLIFGGVYILAETVIEKTSYRVLFIVALLFSTGIERYTHSAYVAQLIYLPFGFDIAVGYGAYSVSLLVKQCRQEKLDLKFCALSAFSMLMTVGHKAPVALIYLMFGGVICFIWLINKKWKKAFSYGFALVLAFMLVMVICIGFLLPVESRVNAGSFGINANLKYSKLYEWRNSFRMAQASTLKEKVLSLITEIAALLAMIVSFNPLMVFLDACAVLFIIKNRNCDAIDWALLAATLFGLFMGSFNEQNGMSQMYYSQASYLTGLAFGFRNFKQSGIVSKTICLICMSVLLAFQIRLYFSEENILSSILNNASDLLSGELPHLKENDSTEFEYPIDSIQYSEYEAMQWIKKNTPVDSVIMPDKDVCKGQGGYMYYGTFAERQTYLEGAVYLYDAYFEEREQRRIDISHIYLNYPGALDIAKSDGVDYIIQTKWIIPTYEGNGCTLVFENDMVKIWKVGKA